MVVSVVDIISTKIVDVWRDRPSLPSLPGVQYEAIQTECNLIEIIVQLGRGKAFSCRHLPQLEMRSLTVNGLRLRDARDTS